MALVVVVAVRPVVALVAAAVDTTTEAVHERI